MVTAEELPRRMKMRTKNNFYSESNLGDRVMPVGAYCSPQPEITVDGVTYPSKITYRYYGMLADLGVNIVYGHAEAIGRENEELVYQALRLCEKVGIRYLVRDLIAEEYVSLGHRAHKDWRTLSEDERRDLNMRFQESILKYKDYPAFAGISFFDEPGLDSFEGVAAAKEVFLRVCPDKLFYVNMLPNHIAAKQLQYGACMDGVPECDKEELKEDKGNDNRYEYFLKRYLNVVWPQVFSYDSYPFLTLAGVESMHHIALYELQQFGHFSEREYGIPYWPFMQVGGKWEGSANRVTDYAEMLLQINLALAYGAKGIQLFPVCFPNDWLKDKVVRAGVIDRYGDATEQYHYLKTALRQLKACQKYLMKSRLQNVMLRGRFEGLLPAEEELQRIQWNETIFRGKLPRFNNVQCERYRELDDMDCTSQFFAGCFIYENSSLFYVVNNSIVTAGNVRLKFNKKCEYELVYKGEQATASGTELYLQRVAAGDGFLIRIISSKGE